jgi:hypothetical protein
MKIVLDAWAILAYLQREEPAASRVREILKKAEARQVDLFVSLINVGEVFYSYSVADPAPFEPLPSLHGPSFSGEKRSIPLPCHGREEGLMIPG